MTSASTTWAAATERPLALARAALAGRPAWLVGGALRERALGRPTADLDLVIDGDPADVARLLARSGRAASFALSEDFGAWRVVAREGGWQIDVERLRGESLEADLALRDFTVNAVAEPLAGGEPIDPLGGLEDLAAGRLRMAGRGAFADDPLRVLRLVRLAVELGLDPEPQTARAAGEHAPDLRSVSPERVFMELRRIIDAPAAPRGLELMGELGVTAVVLPELEALRGVAQRRFHHRDVYGHTLEVLEGVLAIQADPEAVLAQMPNGPDELRGSGGSGGLSERDAGAEHRRALADEVAALLGEPLADGVTRGGALRWGALLHDAGKPLTRAVRPTDGRVTFIGHDDRGAELARSVLGRLRASERLRGHVAALVRNHLRLGMLVHEPQPLARRTVFAYLRACEPVEVDVTLLSIADRLGTRGDRSQEAIDAHMRVAGGMLDDALRWRADGTPRPLWRGDELARELGIGLGPRVGELLEELAEAQYAGEVGTREQALAYARASE